MAAPVATIAYLAKYFIPYLLKYLPGIRISFFTYQPNAYSNIELDFDILVASLIPENKNLIIKTITQFSAGIFATPEYLNTHPLNHPSQVFMHECIMHNALQENRHTWCYTEPETGNIKEVTIHGQYYCDHIISGIELAKKSIGLLYAPLFQVSDDIKNGLLTPCFNEAYNVTYNGYLAYRGNTHLSEHLLAFIQHLTDFIEQSDSK